MFDEIQFYLFNHHHYIDIPPDEQRYESTWVSYPNELSDPEKGHALYQRYTRELLLAEDLGFDAIALNEHHQTAYSMMPAVGIRAAYMAALTKRVKLLVAGTPINFSWPSRIAEEYAMLDVLSGGRMEFGFPLGTGMEYWSNAGQINPATARARFREGLDIIFKSWTEPGPQRNDGEFYNYRYLNTWPKPYQRPRPKAYIVGSGSKETVDLALDAGTGYSIVFTPIEQQLKAFASFRERAAERGRKVLPEDLIFNAIVYVADTDAEAVAEARPHIENFFSWFHRVPSQFLSPPGYVSRAEFLRRASSAALADGTHATWDDMVSIGRIACGSPQTVADTISRWALDAGSNRILVTLQHGNMPEWKAVKNMTLFASEVMPRVRAQVVHQPKTPEAKLAAEGADMARLEQQTYKINGIETVVLSAGSGTPIVFLHGAGTGTGFEVLAPLAEQRRIIVPIHPGFGASADDPSIDSVHDYRRHYLDLFDALDLDRVDVVGHSMGGYIASTLAIDSRERVRSLVLAAPLGLRVPEHPTVDIFTIPGKELFSWLTEDLSIFAGVPSPPTPEFLAAGFREMTSAARLLWARNYDLKLARWLHRLVMPTLLLWGDKDRMIPVGQAAVWASHIPGAQVKILPGVGHLLFDESAEAVAAIQQFVSRPIPAR